MQMTSADKARLAEFCNILEALEALGPQGKTLARQLGELHGDEQVATEDRVLRACGTVLLEHAEHAASLFETIYARVHEGGIVVEPGDARRFLFSELPQ